MDAAVEQIIAILTTSSRKVRVLSNTVASLCNCLMTRLSKLEVLLKLLARLVVLDLDAAFSEGPAFWQSPGFLPKCSCGSRTHVACYEQP